MLDWKILAAGFVALLFVSSVIVGNYGLKDFVTQIVDGIEGIFGSTPVTGFSIGGPAGTKEIDVTINPLEMTLRLDDVDIQAGAITFNNFVGDAELNFVDNTVTFKEANSKLKVSLPAQKLDVSRVNFGSFTVSGVKFLIKPNIFSADGSLELTGFSGRADIDVGSLRLTGNVSKARVILDGNKWELV